MTSRIALGLCLAALIDSLAMGQATPQTASPPPLKAALIPVPAPPPIVPPPAMAMDRSTATALARIAAIGDRLTVAEAKVSARNAPTISMSDGANAAIDSALKALEARTLAVETAIHLLPTP